MSFKTILAIIITIGLTVVIIQNTDETTFTILFIPVALPKLVMLTAVSVSAFILGLLVSRPGKSQTQSYYNQYEDEEEDDNEYPKKRHDTLSDEDRDYIS
jgi:uncharacterized integral membrane protein